MFSSWIKEDQTIWIAVIISVVIHGLFLVFSRTTFIQHAQFSVQPSAQRVEVSIEEVKIDRHSEGVHRRTRTDLVPGTQGTRSILKVKANPGYFQNPSPEYPELAKQMRQEGLVLLSVDVDRTGEPLNVEIIQSSGYRLLDQAALKAVSHWRFQPGSIGNIPIDSTVTVPIRFRLEK